MKRSAEGSRHSIHCRRVAATGAEFARLGGLSARDQEIAFDAGLIHHYPRELLSFKAVAPLLSREERNGTNAAAFVRHVVDTLTVLAAMDPMSAAGRRDPLPDLMAAAHLMVDETEAALEQGDDIREAMLARIRRRTEEGIHLRKTFATIATLPRPERAELMQAASRLPAHPAVALRALRVAVREDASFQALSAIASDDQVLASHLIRAANSCLYGVVTPVATIRHAMTFIGLDETRRILMAASLRRAFATAAAEELWRYSLTTARWCEAAAALTNGIPPEEAFLAGLVHDIGRSVILHYPGEAGASAARLVARGADPVFAEMFLFGLDHAGVGAEVLAGWNFPENIVEAVRRHHSPERSVSAMASLLFLADAYCSETIGSASQRAERHAFEVTGIDPVALAGLNPGMGALGALLAA